MQSQQGFPNRASSSRGTARWSGFPPFARLGQPCGSDVFGHDGNDVGLDVLGRSVKPYATQDTDEQGYNHDEGGSGKNSCQGFHFLDPAKP